MKLSTQASAAVLEALNTLKTRNRYTVSITEGSDTYDLFRYPADAQHTEERFYIGNRQDEIGRGCFGVVRKVYSIDSDTAAINEAQPYAAKIMNPTNTSESLCRQEIAMLKRYYRTEDYNAALPNVVITQFLPGESLGDAAKYRNVVSTAENSSDQLLRKLNFQQRVNLINQIILAFNSIHHTTPSTGPAMLHGDVKGENLRVFIDPKTLKTEAAVIDFGFSADLDSTDRKKLVTKKAQGTPIYIAPEVLGDRSGIASDIYSLTAVFSYILGAYQCVDEKCHARNPLWASFMSFDLRGLLQGFGDHLPDHMKSSIGNFLNRMQAHDHTKRPSSDETLRFFTTLNKWAKIQSLQNEFAKIQTVGAGELESAIKMRAQESRVLEAQLVLLSLGLWNKTAEQYDFSAHPTVCQAILSFKNPWKNGAMLRAIMQDTPYSTFEENVAKVSDFLSRLDDYQAGKRRFLHENPKRRYSGSRFGYTVAKKIEAAELLKKTLTGEVAVKTFFSSEHKQARKALKQGQLGKETPAMMTYLKASMR